jgi:hypothetical protein
MSSSPPSDLEEIAREVRLYIFRTAAETTRVPQRPEIAAALHRPPDLVHEALRHLAAGRVLMLAPNDGAIWAAAPFCAVPSGFRVEAGGKRYWSICVWDALGVPAILGRDARIEALCGDCGDRLMLEVRDGALHRSEGVIHFAIPARHWWDNIGFT